MVTTAKQIQSLKSPFHVLCKAKNMKFLISKNRQNYIVFEGLLEPSRQLQSSPNY